MPREPSAGALLCLDDRLIDLAATTALRRKAGLSDLPMQTFEDYWERRRAESGSGDAAH